ncbi:Arylsulfatase A [Zobellia uliginosa]|uniref:Arylsulfatase A n=1 Tax=Zobellia uliginosa TaxID=143224 RepID=A0ABY1KPT7_9FLAO|nr:sulfatase-like hydrolase/transferase [Zobellia uliginosa]SIS49163.1 Arylsulfatase A [Zobellia uliginosa]
MKPLSIFVFILIISAPLRAQYNILFIESDDQSNQTVGAFGNSAINTPNIDQLVHEGVSFTSAYNMGCWSPAVCVPSRTMLFYGKYLWDSEKITPQNAPKALPELLKENGYTTYMTGKWHAWGKKPTQLFDSLGTIQPGQLKTYYTQEGHVTDITAKEAIRFIQDYDNEKPFFLYVAFNAPHVPRQTDQRYYDLYPTDKIKLPPSVIEGPLNKNIVYNYTSAPLRKKTMRSRVQQNNAMVSHMDERIGDILMALKASGTYDKTIIIFMSDHGINFGENGVAGKVCLYEPSVTAPLIIKAPGLAQGKKLHQRVYLQDITPTLLDLLDIKKPKTVSFKSLLPIIEKNKRTRSSLYLAMFDDQRGIISKDKKLILYPKSGDLELYDLATDPWETKNLTGSEASEKTISTLLDELVDWQEKTGDKIDLKKTYNHYFK